MKETKKDILRIFFKPLTILNNVIKKNDKLIFFYSNMGFRDNVKALYDYMIEQGYNERFRIVVSADDYMDYEKSSPQNVTFVSNKKGIRFFIQAKYAFYCFGKYPIKPSKKQTVVNLWHGTPLKRVGNLEKGCENVNYNYFTSVITASKEYPPIMARIFGCEQSSVEVLGYPRNDEMFRVSDMTDKAIRRGCRKLILWLPTYRDYDEEFVVPSLKMQELEQLNEFLKGIQCRMIIKLHPLQKVDMKGVKLSYIEFITQKELDKGKMTVYTLLRNADGLITDYSSVYFDYMLLDRPIAFAAEDMEEYKENRGFVFDNPEEYMPGSRINCLEDVERFVSDIVNGQDEYRDARNKINDRVNFYKDGESSRRIVERFMPEVRC